MTRALSNLTIWAASLFSLFFFGSLLSASDQPQWGQAWSRNMVYDETGLASSFDPKTGRNIKWVAQLGSEAHSTPGRAAVAPKSPQESYWGMTLLHWVQRINFSTMWVLPFCLFSGS